MEGETWQAINRIAIRRLKRIAMETTISILLFVALALNPAMAISYLTGLGLVPQNEKAKERVVMVKVVQAINGVISIALFVLVQILFNNLANGQTINW